MKKLIIIVIFLVGVQLQGGHAADPNFFGVYESTFLADIFGDQKVPEGAQEAHDKAKITIEIREDKITANIPDGEVFSETYELQGRVIIVKAKIVGKDMIYTFYLGENGILYGMGQRFKKRD